MRRSCGYSRHRRARYAASKRAAEVAAAVDALLRAARLDHVIDNVGAGMATQVAISEDYRSAE
jgi:hypothetical protein